jgi:hypothetical protein
MAYAAASKGDVVSDFSESPAQVPVLL